VAIVVDANRSMSFDKAVAAARLFKDCGVEYFEDPLRDGTPGDLKKLQEVSGMPICLDESLCTLADAEYFLRAGIKIWNLRVAKNGGFTGMQRFIELAQQHQVRLHLGATVGESQLLAAAQFICTGMAPFEHIDFGFSKILTPRDFFETAAVGYFGFKTVEKDTTDFGLVAPSKYGWHSKTSPNA